MREHKNKNNLRHGRKRKAWPMILLLSGGLLLVIGAVFAFMKPSQPKAAVEVAGEPSLKVDQEKVDLGNVRLGKTVEVTFQLTNVGDQTLRFSKAPYIEVLEGC
jgi:cell division septal protein FtsQ